MAYAAYFSICDVPIEKLQQFYIQQHRSSYQFRAMLYKSAPEMRLCAVLYVNRNRLNCPHRFAV